MSDEPDNDSASHEPTSAGVRAAEAGAGIGSDAPGPPSPRPPPKPKDRPTMPSVRPPEPRPVSAPPPPPAKAAPKATSKPTSIKPMQMIKLGRDRPRSQPPPSSLDRLSRPPGFDPPTNPVRSFDPPTEPIAPEPLGPGDMAFELPTLPEDDEEPITPPRASSEPARGAPARTVSKPPPPPSARLRDSAPQIEVLPVLVDVSLPGIAVTPGEMVEMDVEVAPDSGEEISVSEEPVATEETAPRDEAPSSRAQEASSPDGEKPQRKPPPPPKRVARAPSEHAVAAALEAPKFETISAKPRAKPWWEDLFTDDFARAIMPLTPRQVAREVDFIEGSLGVAKGGVVLDLACGTGHHAVELSSRGYGVVGFDLSVPQLAVAGEYAQERGQKMNFLQGDMRDMSFEEVFDGVYCWNTSFGYFEEDKNVAVAHRVFRALRPGGSFLLDVANRDFISQHQPSQVWFEGDSCVCMDDMSVDFITSRLRVKRTMMLDDGRTRECSYSIRIYSLHELGKLLHDIGFRVTEASGHPAYPGVFLGASSPRVVILAQKP